MVLLKQEKNLGHWATEKSLLNEHVQKEKNPW